MQLNQRRGLAVFTDGSCHHKEKIGGWAWIALDPKSIVSDKGRKEIVYNCGQVLNCTSNQMEIYAVSEALRDLYSDYGPAKITLYSDSTYVVENATDKTRTRRVNLDHWEELDATESLHKSVKFVHVKGHSKNVYNDLAHSLANKARKGE